MDYKAVYETLKSAKETEALLADDTQTANALLTLKHGIVDARDQGSLSYSLMALCTLLQNRSSSSAWSVLDQSFMDHLVNVAANQEQPPNVICPALSIIGLVCLESKQHERLEAEQCPDLVKSFNRDPTFVPVLVARLASSHIQTVFVALQTLNSMLVGLFLTPEKRNHIYCSLREADLFKSCSYLIENKPISSSCRPQLYDLQQLIKSCMKKTKNMPVDLDNNIYHRLTFDATEKHLRTLVGVEEHSNDQVDWHKAGVPDGLQPTELFNQMETCWAGMLDFNDIFNEDRMAFKKLFLEQVAFAKSNARFPLLKASLAVTNILYNLFHISAVSDTISPQLLAGRVDTLTPPTYIQLNKEEGSIPSPEEGFDFQNTAAASSRQAPPPPPTPPKTSQNSVEKLMNTMDNLRPLFFDWHQLHFSGISNFMRIWQASCAETGDFANIQQVMQILYEKATQHAITASSSSAVENVISKLDFISYEEIRATQLKQVENKMNDKWGEEIRHLHRQFLKESEDFVREQRVRLLLNGDWFYIEDPTIMFLQKNQQGSNYAQQQRTQNSNPNRRYFIALSPSRKSLQYSQFPQKLEDPPAAELLTRSIDLAAVTKVNVVPITHATPNYPKGLKRVNLSSRTNYTKISLLGSSGSRDGATLSFYSDTPEKAAAWGDGLLMLKNRSFQSADTKRFIEMFADSKLRMQMLSLAPQDLDSEKHEPIDDQEFDRSQVSTDFYYKA